MERHRIHVLFSGHDAAAIEVGEAVFAREPCCANAESLTAGSNSCQCNVVCKMFSCKYNKGEKLLCLQHHGRTREIHRRGTVCQAIYVAC